MALDQIIHDIKNTKKHNDIKNKETVILENKITLKNIFFQYPKMSADILNNINLKKYNNKKSILSIFFLVILIIELIPVRSYGSIFQTVNGSMFWFIVSLMSSIKWIKLDKITFSYKKK